MKQLKNQIQQFDQRIALKKSELNCQRIAIKHKFASPKYLIIAAIGGFSVGLLLRKKKVQLKSSNAPKKPLHQHKLAERIMYLYSLMSTAFSFKHVFTRLMGKAIKTATAKSTETTARGVEDYTLTPDQTAEQSNINSRYH